MQVSQNEFDEWLENPVTKALKDRIRKDILFMQELLVEVGKDGLEELQGRIKASRNLLEVSREDLYE